MGSTSQRRESGERRYFHDNANEATVHGYSAANGTRSGVAVVGRQIAARERILVSALGSVVVAVGIRPVVIVWSGRIEGSLDVWEHHHDQQGDRVDHADGRAAQTTCRIILLRWGRIRAAAF